MDLSNNLDMNSSILDLSQRTTTNSIDNWSRNDCSCICSYVFENEFSQNESIQHFNIEYALTDQYENLSIKNESLSDSSHCQPSKFDLEQLIKKSTCSSRFVIRINELEAYFDSSPYCSSNFLWSTYLSILNERSVSDEFFDHYLSSIHSGFEINMKLEYCYDIQRDLYWLTKIQLVSHCLIYLHYIGISDDDTSNDFWTNIYDQRCHPIGWCKENSKLMLPPPILTKRTIQQTARPILNSNLDKHLVKTDNEQVQTPANYLFDRNMGLNPIEQLKIGMILEIQDFDCPWTLWFVRIVDNRGGRLHLRYLISTNIDDLDGDIHIFYLDWHVHSIGWCQNQSSIYSYEYPTNLSMKINNKQQLIEFYLNYSRQQFIPENLFENQEQIRSHRFDHGQKLEIFDQQTQMFYVGQIGQIYNEFYFDIHIDNEYQTKFIAHATHPFILPINWSIQHRFALMKGKVIRQSDDYWKIYREKTHDNNLAFDRDFHLITLNSIGNNRIEIGMKMEMILTVRNRDLVVAVTLIHIADHLMWLRIDNPMIIDEQIKIYHVVPINSLDIFPVGWAKFNRFEFIPPIDYRTTIRTLEQNQFDRFSFVTNYPKISRIYFNEPYQLTLFINIRCFTGPNICSSRLNRLPSQFGPGPYQHVLIDMFHHLLSTISTSTNALRALRRLEHSSNENFQTFFIKAAKRTSKLIRPISLPKNARLIYHYLRLMCTQLEACPNLISMKQFEQKCPDQCFILTNTFAHSFHSKHKRTQLRTGQNRQRKQKSLLSLLKPNSLVETTTTTTTTNINTTESSSTVDESPPSQLVSDDVSPTNLPAPSLPGTDRKTRGFRVHIEPRTHTVTRTNKKQKPTVKQEPEQVEETISESPISICNTMKEPKRCRIGKNKRASSPLVTMNILSEPISSTNKSKKKRRSSPIADDPSSSTADLLVPKIETTPLAYPIPLINTQNPVTWNVNDVCSYLNQSGCSFALKTIQEQEIDGAALLLLDDLPKVQDLLEFKLGPAVKFCHVVEQLRTQVIDTFHSSPSLKTSSRLSTTNTS